MPAKIFTAALAALAVIGVTASAGAQAPRVAAAGTDGRPGEIKAVVELFTSQGCSSCPPADKLLGELAGHPSLLALTEPIDYWDYLGWKDTLARPRHTVRQRGYAHVRGDRDVYTPQMVINGVVQVLGSDTQAVGEAIAHAGRGEGTGLPVQVGLASRGERIEISAAAENKPGMAAEVWLSAISKAMPVTIRKGENRGRTITYHNVVRRWLKVGDWNGQAQSWTVSRSDFYEHGVDTVAVLLQLGPADKPGRILGAAIAPLH